MFERLACYPGCGLKRVFIMTADVIVAGPLDSDCNCEYPPLHLSPPPPLPSAITSCHRQKKELLTFESCDV